MAKRAKIGIIGAGNISDAYLRLAKVYSNLEVTAIADILPEAAKARADQYGVRAMTVKELLASDDIAVVINLTVPDAHYQITRDILSAGKHAYTEKPLALNTSDAKKLVTFADKRGLKLGGAPDTFLGAGGQRVRQLVDKGAIGRVIGGTAYVMSHGMEMWHPNPGFFYQPGAGPVWDVGVYYVTALCALLGPVSAVTAMASKGFEERLVTSNGPMNGKRIKVTTPTNINAIMSFANGAQITLGASWDVWRHGHSNPIELYGEKGTMLVPDPNFFAGKISYSDKGGDYTEVDTADGPFGTHNWPWAGPFTRANYRMLGVADLIDAAAKGREPRCSGRLGAHVVEVMEAILTAAADKSFVKVKSTIERPAPLTPAEAKRLMAKVATADATA